MTTTISLCMIVKNESHNLHRCLQSVQGFVNQIIVVDTGSEDNTVEIARSYGAEVYFFEWCDDFAAARNYSLSFATGDWILILDADEKLIIGDREVISNTLGSSLDLQAFALPLVCIDDIHQNVAPGILPRLFHNFLNISYCGVFHEVPCDTSGKPILFYKYLDLHDNLKIEHYGYNVDNLKQKTLNRNIPILEKERESQGLNFLQLFTLFDAYQKTDQIEKAEECYNEAFERLFPYLIEQTKPEDLTGAMNFVYCIGKRAAAHQDHDTLALVCQTGLIWEPDSPYINYLTGVLLTDWGFTLGAISYFEECLKIGQETTSLNVLVNQSLMRELPAYTIGCNYQKLGNKVAALEAFALALQFNPSYEAARDKINELQKQ
jgi:glycosyltransferase involved in cell wall biosynthesis